LRLHALRRLTGRFFGSAPCQPLGVHARLLGRLLACALLGEPALRQLLDALTLGRLLARLFLGQPALCDVLVALAIVRLLACALLDQLALCQFLAALPLSRFLHHPPRGILGALACL
jgi:hypothetical protein